MIWLVALGGALGSVSRFLLGPARQRALDDTVPAGTLLINILGRAHVITYRGDQ